MNKSQWETRLAQKQRKRKKVLRVVRDLETDIAECFTAIEIKRRQEVISNRQLGSRRLKALADVTYPGKEIDGTKI